MNINFDDFLPNPNAEDTYIVSIESVLSSLKSSIDSRYNGKIISSYTSTSKINETVENILVYAFYLQFPNHDDYIYRLFEAECINKNGSYPVKVKSHYGPPIDHGKVENVRELEKVIELILKEEKTRAVILSLY